jgi:hypothetical protein
VGDDEAHGLVNPMRPFASRHPFGASAARSRTAARWSVVTVCHRPRWACDMVDRYQWSTLSMRGWMVMCSVRTSESGVRE